MRERKYSCDSFSHIISSFFFLLESHKLSSISNIQVKEMEKSKKQQISSRHHIYLRKHKQQYEFRFTIWEGDIIVPTSHEHFITHFMIAGEVRENVGVMLNLLQLVLIEIFWLRLCVEIVWMFSRHENVRKDMWGRFWKYLEISFPIIYLWEVKTTKSCCESCWCSAGCSND